MLSSSSQVNSKLSLYVSSPSFIVDGNAGGFEKPWKRLMHVTVDEEAVAVAVAANAVGRRLKALSTDDYNDPSANRGHDPRNRIGGSGGWKVREP